MGQQPCSSAFTQRNWKLSSSEACIRKLSSALLTATLNWKQPRCPSVEEWTNWGIRIACYYSAQTRKVSRHVEPQRHWVKEAVWRPTVRSQLWNTLKREKNSETVKRRVQVCPDSGGQQCLEEGRLHKKITERCWEPWNHAWHPLADKYQHTLAENK